MDLFIEVIKFLLYSLVIVGIAKYLLVSVLRKLAEGLKLKPKTVGNIAGIATSVPELLTVSFSTFAGLIDTSVFNILSSNIINVLQYMFSIVLNKNRKLLKNRALQIDMVLVILTIIIPIIMLIFNLETSIYIVPVFLLLFVFCYYINNNAHKLYLKHVDLTIEKEILEEEKKIQGKKGIVIKYTFYLIIIGIALYFVGNLLTISLENLCNFFKIPQFIIGITLGFVTSLPELITFFETQKHHNKTENQMMGMVEATNNLLTSNVLNLFIIQSIGILIYIFI